MGFFILKPTRMGTIPNLSQKVKTTIREAPFSHNGISCVRNNFMIMVSPLPGMYDAKFKKSNLFYTRKGSPFPKKVNQEPNYGSRVLVTNRKVKYNNGIV